MGSSSKWGTAAVAAMVVLGLGGCDAGLVPELGGYDPLSPSFAKGGRGGGPPGEEGPPATIIVRDLSSGDAVWNDGDPLYIDGDLTTTVAITDGDFHFQPGGALKGKNKGEPDRDINMDLGTPADTAFQDPWGPHPLDSFDFRIHQGLVNRPCGTSQTHGRFAWGSSLGYAHLSFAVPNVNFQGDPLTVTRVDNGDGTSTWTIVSTGEGYLQVDNEYAGTFLMPFEFEVTGEPGGCP